MKGIDVSVWQEPSRINYDKLVKEIDFAIIRAGYTGHGTGKSLHKDEHFEKHYAEFTKRGVPVGAYWYSCAVDSTTAKAEADYFLTLIKGKKFGLPIVMDVEDEYHQAEAGKQRLTEAVITFGETIENAGYYFSVYSNQYWFNTYMSLSQLKRFDLWVANWVAKENPMLGLAGIWQFRSDGRLEGYAGDLDLNRAYKDYPNIMQVNGLNGYTKPPVGVVRGYGLLFKNDEERKAFEKILENYNYRPLEV